MSNLFAVDWRAVFVPSGSVVEIILRGTLVYISLFVLLRLMRREAGGLGIADVLVIVLIADASQNAMANEYKSVSEGILLVGTIIFWDFTFDWLAYHLPWFHRLFQPAPLPLVKDGHMMRRNMRQEMITEEELMSQLRQQGVEKLAAVKKCYLEGDGSISVITGKKKPQNAKTGSRERL